MTTCAIYIRKSTTERQEDGNRSRELQLETCQKIAQDNGYTIVETYSQIVSGYSLTAKRTEFNRMLTDLKNGRFNVLVTVREDRLGRRLSETAKLLDLCEQTGVKIHTTNGLIDPANKQGTLIYNLMSAIAQNESELISARVKANRDHIKTRTWTGGTAPYGFTPSPRNEQGTIHLTHHPKEAPTVQRMAELILTHKQGIGETAQTLTNEGHTTRSGKPWTYKAVQATLLNPTIAGYATELKPNAPSRSPRHLQPITHNGQPVLIHQPIITPEQWEQIKATITPRTSIHRKTRRSPTLSGLVYCSECGSKMVGGYATRNNQIHRRYQCPNFALPADQRCRNAIASLVLEEYVEDFTRALLKDDNLRKAFDAHRTTPTTNTHQINQLRQAQETLTQQLTETLNPHVITILTTKLNDITEQLDTLEQERTQALIRHNNTLTFNDIYNFFHSLNPTQRRYAIHQLLQRITIHPGELIYGGRRGAALDMHRIELHVTGQNHTIRLPKGTPSPPTQKVECRNCNQLIHREHFPAHYEDCSSS